MKNQINKTCKDWANLEKAIQYGKEHKRLAGEFNAFTSADTEQENNLLSDLSAMHNWISAKILNQQKKELNWSTKKSI